jgi:hypothetical protein
VSLPRHGALKSNERANFTLQRTAASRCSATAAEGMR